MVANVDIAPGSASWFRLARRAKVLAALTLVWLGIEGAIGVVAGLLAGSIVLVAFGLDSAIEGLASVIVIWRFTGARTISADAERRWLGIGLTAGTLVLCPWLGRAKRCIGEKIGSRATYGEGTQNVLCAILAGGVLVGLTANTLFGLWWLDPAIALAISAICVREGQKAWRGEQCGCATCS